MKYRHSLLIWIIFLCYALALHRFWKNYIEPMIYMLFIFPKSKVI